MARDFRETYTEMEGRPQVSGSASSRPALDFYLANPSAPYSIQKCPELQLCPKFVPTFVFHASNQGGAKICQKFVEKLKICPETVVYNFSTNFDKFWPPLIGSNKNKRRDKFWTNLGFGAFLNAVRGRRVRNFSLSFRKEEVSCQKLQTPFVPRKFGVKPFLCFLWEI